MPDLIGKSMGSYEIHTKIGKGGMATVYRAYHPGLERDVAIKVMPEEFTQDSGFMARFDREAKIVARLQHPNILSIYDYGQQDGIPYLVMPLMTGGTLRDAIAQQNLSLEDAARLITQIAGALDYAHQQGILHRDVKPGNILIDLHGNALLSDFGLTRLAEHVSAISGTSIIGTPAYMSPEQGRGASLDARSDEYSLGVTLYEMITGQVPFRAETPIAVIFQHISDEVPPLREALPELPEAAETVVMRALAKDPDNRFTTCGAMAEAFASAVFPAGNHPLPKPIPPAYDTLSSTVFATPPLSKQAARPGRRLWVITGVSALFIVVIFFVVMAILMRDDGDETVAAEESLRNEATAEPLSGEDAAATLIMERATQTATLWTLTPTQSNTPTITLTPSQTLTPTTNFTATVEKIIADYATQTATQWTPSPTPNALATAQTGILHNADWEPVIETFDGVEMVLVPAGCFMMGSEEGEDDETPIHQQCFDKPFWIGRTEVTNLQYGNQGNWAGDDRPRETISWFEAKGYCEARGERLPTEPEFEYVSRGPDGLRFPWGDEFEPDNVVYDGNSGDQTDEVGSHPGGASWVGALDLAGNVWEWTSSTYQSYPLNPESLGGAPNDTTSLRVMRGGSFDYPMFNVRSAYRYTSFPHNDHFNLGVRCVRDL